MAAVDNFPGSASQAPGQDYPATRVDVVTPSDTAGSGDLPVVSRAIYVGGAGNVAVVMRDNSTATFTAVPVGTTLQIRCKRIAATGTTATLMLALS